MASAHMGRLALVLAGFTLLSACEEGQEFNLFGAGQRDSDSVEALAGTGTGRVTVEQDVESPEVFQQSDSGLWDGRPSLGGVWIAHPDVIDPERVMIRNEENGNFVIGALFRRERENPGPKFQVSSDAANELGMLAGAPSDLNVVALRQVEVPVEAEITSSTGGDDARMATLETLGPSEEIQATPLDSGAAPLDPVAALAASAIEAATQNSPSASLPAPTTAAETAMAATAPPPPVASPAPSTPVAAPASAPLSSLAKPFIQIGIYSVESNATKTANSLRSSGIIPTIKKSGTGAKTYWRVVVGPIGNSSDRSTVLKKVQGLGYADAYSVTN